LIILDGGVPAHTAAKKVGPLLRINGDAIYARPSIYKPITFSTFDESEIRRVLRRSMHDGAGAEGKGGNWYYELFRPRTAARGKWNTLQMQ